MTLVTLFLPFGVPPPSYVVEATPGTFNYVVEATAMFRLADYGDTPVLNGSVAYGELIGAGGFMPVESSPIVGSYTPE